jgi:hypothetical protein
MTSPHDVIELVIDGGKQKKSPAGDLRYLPGLEWVISGYLE